MPELFSIDIITENNMTNPPIIRTVLIALIMLLDKTSPKFEKVTIFLLEEAIALYEEGLSIYFQNLNIIPTIIQDKM